MDSLPGEIERMAISQQINPLDNSNSLAITISSLPVELCQTILSFLSLKDIKSIRLTSHHWSTLGLHYLLSPVFNTLPHQDPKPVQTTTSINTQ